MLLAKLVIATIIQSSFLHIIANKRWIEFNVKRNFIFSAIRVAIKNRTLFSLLSQSCEFQRDCAESQIKIHLKRFFFFSEDLYFARTIKPFNFMYNNRMLKVQPPLTLLRRWCVAINKYAQLYRVLRQRFEIFSWFKFITQDTQYVQLTVPCQRSHESLQLFL